MNKYFKTNSCRICQSKNLKSYINLGNHPFSNSFLKKKQIKLEQSFPLNVLLCLNCGLSQLSIIPNPKNIFDKYDYLSSSSVALQNHYKSLTKYLIERFKLNSYDLILDIGCNDGVLLNQYPFNFKNLIGVEPSDVYKKIKNKNVKIFNNFFNFNLSQRIKKKFNEVKIITATNVFAHIHDLSNFIKGIDNLTNKDSIIIIEFPYLIEMIDKGLFDLIYHEHLSYLSISPISKLLKATNLKIFDYKKINFGASGPSIRLFITKNDSKLKVRSKIKHIIAFEKNWGLKKISKYYKFNKMIYSNMYKLKNLILEKFNAGYKIGCFSAPAKGNTLLNYLNLDKGIISYVCENNKSKIGKYTPGTHIKIINDELFLKKNIHYSLLLSWNYKNFFISNSLYIKKGGKFILPLPKPQIIPK